MPLFDEIGKKISQTTQSALKGTKDFADIARLNSQIAEEQKLCNSFYMQIGQKYYEMHKGDGDDDFGGLCASITDSIAKIADLQNGIQEIRGIKKCQGCGAEIPASSTFCGTCGHDTRLPGAEGEGAPAAVEPAGRKCPGCGADVAEGVSFCTGCGCKL